MSEETTLESQLGKLRAAAAERTPEEIRTLAAQFLTKLEQTTVQKALAVGAKAPDFVLQAADDDRKVWLAEELRHGPVVLSFYRGQWCPYCNLEVNGMQAHYQDMLNASARVYLIGPETRDNAQKLTEKTGSSIPILYDLDGEVMAAYGLEFSIPESLQPMYARFGFPETNPRTGWRLPLPATYVIARDGDVVARYVNADHSRRMEPADIIAALKSLA